MFLRYGGIGLAGMVVEVGVIPTMVVGLIAFSFLAILRFVMSFARALITCQKEESMERTNLINKTKLFALSISETFWAMGTSAILPAQFLLMH